MKVVTANPRAGITGLIQKADLKGLLERAAEVHGHYCPGLASGVKAAYAGASRLDLPDSEGMERVMAEVECNNCFVDGIQVVTGCTFGNNALIYRDLGKTAVTLYRRGEGSGLRIAVKNIAPGVGLSDAEQRDAQRLFEKAVKQRQEHSEEEGHRFRQLWAKSGHALLEQPDEDVLEIESVEVAEPEYAPIYDSVTCSACREKVMETRVRLRSGEPVCLTCAGERHWLVDGSGIRLSQ